MLLRLQIISTGQFLVLAKDDVLTVEIQSTLFNNQDEFLGSFSYEGTMPLEPNRATIQNAHLITSSADLRTLEVMAYLGSKAWKQVRLNFTIEDNDVKYRLYIDSTILNNRLKTLKLQELVDPDHDGQLTFESPAAYKEYMMSTISAAPGTMPMVFFPYKNDGGYKEVPPENYGDYPDLSFPLNNYFNAWQVVDGVGSFLVDEEYPLRNTQTPFFYLVYILERLAQYFGYTIESEWIKEEPARRIVVGSNVPVTGPDIIPDFTYFMPDLFVNKFVQAVRTGFGLLISFDVTRKICIIESLDNLVKTEEVIDLRGRQIFGYRELSTTLRAYTISRGASDKDLAFSDDDKAALPVLTIGDQAGALETSEIPLTDVATKMITEVSPAEAGADTWRLPYIKQSVYGPPPFSRLADIAYSDKNKFELRFLYFYGMAEMASGDEYPYGSADNLDCLNRRIGNYTLALTDTGAAYMATKKYYEFIKNSKPFECGFYSTWQEFSKIKPNARVIIRDRNQATVSCLMDVCAGDLADKSLIYTKATLYPIVRPNNVLPAAGDEEVDPPVDNGAVYLKFLETNHNEYYQPFPPPTAHVFTQDLLVQFFEDAAGLIPKPVANLDVRYKTTFYYTTGSPGVDSAATISCTGTSKILAAAAPQQIIQGSITSRWEYEILPSGDYTIIT